MALGGGGIRDLSKRSVRAARGGDGIIGEIRRGTPHDPPNHHDQTDERDSHQQAAFPRNPPAGGAWFLVEIGVHGSPVFRAEAEAFHDNGN